MKLNTTRMALIVLLSMAMVACGGRNTKPADNGAGNAGSAQNAGSPNATGTKRGGYYLDDGPGDNPPADIDSIPDAMPRQETLYARAARPYSALGQRYTPMTEYAPYKQRGIASWYGKRYHGQKTSAGEVYDMYAMTAAHTILPLPSYARVTNPQNGRSVIVRVNDRGPFHSDRLIDLSYAAAYKLRLTGKGSGLVEVEAIDPRNLAAFNAPGNGKAAVAAPAASSPAPAQSPAPVPVQATTPVAVSPNSIDTEVTSTTIGDNVVEAVAGVYVQVGAFRNKTNADQLSSNLRTLKLVENTPVNSWYNDGTYRVRIGPFASRAEAERGAVQLKQALKMNAYILVLP